MELSKEAVEALIRLEEGAKFNCIHTTARELISAGMAFDGWGFLEITETGRLIARLHRSGQMDPMSTPVNSHNLGFELLPVAPVAFDGVMRGVDADGPVSNVTSYVTNDSGHVDFSDLQGGQEKRHPPPQTEAQKLTWDRDRVRAAAGLANSKCGVWIEAIWVDAFMDAYEEI